MTHSDRVVLFTREGCHLCDTARDVVAQACATAGETWHEVNIDAGPDPARLRDRYGDYVPVVEVDGVQQGFWHVDGDRLVRRLTGGGER
jgi:hypothetical protein